MLAEVIQTVHQAQIEQCFSLTIPQLSAAIAEIYDASLNGNKLIDQEAIIKVLHSAKDLALTS